MYMKGYAAAAAVFFAAVLMPGGVAAQTADGSSVAGSVAGGSVAARSVAVRGNGGSVAATMPLTLEECRQRAEENNVYAKNAALDVRAAQSRKQEVLSEYFPRVSATAMGYWALNPLLEMSMTDLFENGEIPGTLKSICEGYGMKTDYSFFKKGWSAGVTALQPVYAGGRIVTGNRLAALGVEAAGLHEGILRRETRETVDSLWWQVVSLEDKFEVLEHLSATLDTLCSNVRSAVASGLAAETDLLRLEHRRSELAAGKKKLRSGIRLSKMNLFNSIDLSYSLIPSAATAERPYLDSIVLDSGDSLPLSPEHYWKDEDEIVDGMQETHLLALQEKARRMEKRMAVGEALPQISVGATAGYSNLYDKGRCNTIAFALVQIPLSDWGKTARKAQRLDTQIEKAANEREFLEKQLRLQVGKLWLDLTSAYDQWQLAEEALAQSDRLYEAALSNYSAGLAPLQDLLQAETDCRTDASARIDALIAYRTAVLAYTGRCK